MKKFLIGLFLYFPFVVWAQPAPPSDLSGQELRSWLKTNWYDGSHRELTYSQARIAMYGTVDVQDDGNVYCVYTGFNQPSRDNETFLDPINAEHSIPQSFFNSNLPMQSDIHHLYPTHGNVNSARGNDPFSEITDTSTDTWYTGNSSGIQTSSSIPSSNIDAYSEKDANAFEPREDHKGDLARTIFYFYTVYPSQAGNIENIVGGGNLDILLQWHEEDPVDAWELQRNDRVETAQGNRNPYIDYPEIACRAWNLSCSSASSPVITIEENLSDFGVVAFGNASTAQSYTVSGSDLSGDITITASTGFEIALVNDDNEFSESLVLTSNSGTVANTEVFVRFKPAANTNAVVNGTITHTSSGADSQTINVSGTEADESAVPSVSFSGNAVSIDPIDNYRIGININNPGASSGNISIEVILTLNLTYGTNGFVTNPALENETIIIPFSGQETQVNLDVNFGESVYATVSKRLTFSIKADENYDIGTNTTFELTINPGEEEVVTGLDIKEGVIKIYPNPVNDVLSISNSAAYDRIEVYTQQGRKIYTSASVQTIEVSKWKRGIYYMLLFDKNTFTTHKIVVNHN